MPDIEEIFFKAFQLTEAERDSYLSKVCADIGTRNQVDVLLAAHDQASRFLEVPPVSELDDSIELDTHKRWLDETIVPLAEILESIGDPTESAELGNYQLEHMIGYGGMGIVFRAQDTKLGRTVAIKLLPKAYCNDQKYRARFLREARTTAQLSHPNIVAIHAVEDTAIPYIVMEFVSGETLNERLKRDGRFSEDRIVELSLQIAGGLEAAHNKNLVHRDIKPSNILIDVEGNARIVDFGLARILDDSELSLAGEIFGTPRFMSPEQAGGESVDHRTDLFSLGSVMYFMCTGSLPFSETSMAGVMRQVRESEPTPISKINPESSEALTSVVQRLMCKSAEERYQSAGELIRALERINTTKFKPATAKPETRGLTRPMVIASVVIGLLTLFAVTETAGWTRLGGMLMDVIRIETESGTLVVTTDDPDVAVSVNGKSLSIDIGTNEFTYNIGDYVVEARKDDKVILEEVVTIKENGKQIVKIEREVPAPAADDNVATVAGRVPETEANRRQVSPIVGEPITLSGHDQFVLSVRFSPDGRRLASVQFGGKVKVWDLSNNKVIFEARADTQYPKRVFFTPDGSEVVCGTRTWNIETGELSEETNRSVIAFSKDEKRVALLSRNNQLVIVDRATGQSISSFASNQTQIHEADFSPDGKLLATCSDEDLKVWEWETGKRVALFSHDGRRVVCVRFSPDGKMLASGGDDQRLRIWDVADLNVKKDRLLHALTGHDDSVSDVEFLPEGNRIISVSRESAITFPKPGKRKGKTIKLWDLETGREIWNQSGHMHNVTGIDIQSTGQKFVTGSYDHSIKIWELKQTAESPDQR